MAIILAIIFYFTLGLSGTALLIALTYLICYIISLPTKEKKKDCSTCYYYRNGECLTQFQKECKEDGHMLWMEKEQ